MQFCVETDFIHVKPWNYNAIYQYLCFDVTLVCVRILTADLDARDMFDMTAVHLAAENGHVDSLHLLLDAGASCNVATKYSRPGLYTGDISYTM